MHFQIFQHVAFETAGYMLDWIAEKKHSLSLSRLFEPGGLGSPEPYDALIILGGPMSVHDELDHPWLKTEKEMIRIAIRDQKKIMGICLGAQLIAEAAGARVYPSPEKEIGFMPIYLREDGKKHPLLQGFPENPIVFHWHGETFDLPTGATWIAFTDACPHQAFLIGQQILGLQFHLEVTASQVQEMVLQEGDDLLPAPFVQSAERIRAGLKNLDSSREILYLLLDRFFK